MICTRCGGNVQDGSSFCAHCGARLEVQPARQWEQQAVPGIQSTAKSAGKKKTGAIIAALVSFVLVAGLAGGFFYYRYTKKVETYNRAVELLEGEAYREAVELFDELDGFQDSSALSEYGRNCLAYKEALALMEAGKYAEAKAAFDRLGDFSDAKTQSGICAREQERAETYQAALGLYENGQYEEARAQFEKTDGLNDSAAYIEKCDNILQFGKMCEKLKNGNYAKAKSLFSDIDTELLEGLPDYEENYAPWFTYMDAMKALDEGRRYDAYLLFSELGSFEDAASRASDCPLQKPSNGVIYRNRNYSSTSCSLTIKTPNDGRCNFLKIYANNGDLMLSVFIKANSSCTVKFPAGTCSMRIAYGSGDWYGETDMFGDNATYELLTFNDGAETVKLGASAYTLTLRTGETTGDSVGTKNIGRGGM